MSRAVQPNPARHSVDSAQVRCVDRSGQYSSVEPGPGGNLGASLWDAPRSSSVGMPGGIESVSVSPLASEQVGCVDPAGQCSRVESGPGGNHGASLWDAPRSSSIGMPGGIGASVSASAGAWASS